MTYFITYAKARGVVANIPAIKCERPLEAFCRVPCAVTPFDVTP